MQSVFERIFVGEEYWNFSTTFGSIGRDALVIV